MTPGIEIVLLYTHNAASCTPECILQHRQLQAEMKRHKISVNFKTPLAAALARILFL
jgi:hypothetical protein